MPPFPRVFPLRLFCAAALLSAAFAAVAADKPADPIIELPKVIVTDSRELPPPESWHYAEIPGFEILTNASDKETQKLIRDFQGFNYAVDVVWKGLQQKMAVPISLIICGKGGKFDAFVPGKQDRLEAGQVSLFLQDREQAAIVLDFEAKTINLASIAATNAAAAGASVGSASVGSSGSTLPATGPSEDASSAGAASADSGEMEVNHYKHLYREYIHFLMSRSQPRMPPWFEEGLAQLFMGMTFDSHSITFAKLEDPNMGSITGGAEDNDFNKALEGKALMPLQEMFTVERTSAVAINPLGSTWAKQSQAFVHLCLYGEGERYQKSLITFIVRLQKEEPSEALFKECFNKSYKQMLIVLRGYQQFASYKSHEWIAPKGQTIPEPPLITLREATPAEVGRIKGDALRLAGKPEAAHTELVAPYIRGERDPRLLAALGIEERAAGHDERAEKFLEAAVKGKVDRPRAYLEYARMRQRAAITSPAAPDGKLSAAQVASVLSPLQAGRSFPPPLFEMYELMGDTMLRGADVPKKEDIQVMFDGVNQFKGKLGMVYQTAVLCLRAGEMKGAAALVEHGLRYAPDENTRARFALLKAGIPATPPATASAKKS